MQIFYNSCKRLVLLPPCYLFKAQFSMLQQLSVNTCGSVSVSRNRLDSQSEECKKVNACRKKPWVRDGKLMSGYSCFVSLWTALLHKVWGLFLCAFKGLGSRYPQQSISWKRTFERLFLVSLSCLFVHILADTAGENLYKTNKKPPYSQIVVLELVAGETKLISSYLLPHFSIC